MCSGFLLSGPAKKPKILWVLAKANKNCDGFIANFDIHPGSPISSVCFRYSINASVFQEAMVLRGC